MSEEYDEDIENEGDLGDDQGEEDSIEEINEEFEPRDENEELNDELSEGIQDFEPRDEFKEPYEDIDYDYVPLDEPREESKDKTEEHSLNNLKKSGNHNSFSIKMPNPDAPTIKEKISAIEAQLKPLKDKTRGILDHNPYQEQIAHLETILRELQARAGLILTSGRRNSFGLKFDSNLIENKNEKAEFKFKTENYAKESDNEYNKKKIITESYTFPKESEDFAELSTIINGDGNIFYDKGKKYMLRISSNTTEEKEYREYTKDLIKKVFNVQPKSYPRKGKNATDLVIYSKEIVEGLITKGFKPGDKGKNQISVCDWIKKTENFRVRGLKGLFDTDGSIYLRNTQKSIGLNFKNKSLNLVIDFKEMCESLEIKTQKIPKPKISRDHKSGKIYECQQLTIENKLYIAKFLDKIKPEKLYNHAKVIGMSLLTLQHPKERELIKHELDEKYPDKKSHFSKEYESYFRKLCEKHGLEINNEIIITSIEHAMKGKRKGFQTSNKYLERVINDLRIKLGEI